MVRSDIPAVTHIDYSARIQTVSRDTNPDYYDLIHEFERLTGCAVLVNTSFNVRGEPIVCTPADAYRCFMRTHIDHLVLGPFLLDKTGQPEWKESGELASTSSSSTDAGRGPEVRAPGRRRVPRCWRRCSGGATHVTAAAVAGGARRARWCSAGSLVPAQLGPVYRAWMALATAISKVTTPMFMGVIFFLVLTPAGLPRPAVRPPAAHARVADAAHVLARAARDGERRGDLDHQF